jgi:hypothetical protein
MRVQHVRDSSLEWKSKACMQGTEKGGVALCTNLVTVLALEGYGSGNPVNVERTRSPCKK